MTTRIVLADDHTILRQGLRSLLEQEAGLEVVGEAGNGFEVLQAVERLHPDILVLDIMMPEMNGLEALRKVKNLSSGTRVIILSMHAKEAYVTEAIKSGADGYVLKDSQTTDLVQAIRRVMAGGRFLSPALNERAIEVYFDRVRETHDMFDLLTERERQVFQLVAEGLNSSEVAERLTVSPRTVEVYRSNIMHKLGLKTQVDWIRLALKRGILPEE